MPKSSKKTRSRRNKTTLKVGGFWPFDNTNQTQNNTNQAQNNTNQAPANTKLWYEQIMDLFKSEPKTEDVTTTKNPLPPGYGGGKTRRNRKSSKRK